MSEAVLRRFSADDCDWLVQQHSTLYARDEGFDNSFGLLVAGILDDFIASHDPVRERGWIAVKGGQRLGSIFCVKAQADTAKLRLFLVTPQARGRGLGKRLMRACMDFARAAGYRDMQLWTHESHRSACALYAVFGWQLVGSRPVRSFGVDLVEQTWVISL